MSIGFDFAIDFGTSNTAVVVRWPDGRTQPVLFDGSLLLPSAVCREPSGHLLVGKDALAGARMYPDAVELNPKRCIDDNEIVLGGAACPTVDVIAAVLGRAADEAYRVAGGRAGRVVLTYPTAWGPRRQAVLVSAAERARILDPVLVAEPIAAAAYFAGGAAAIRMSPGDCVLVYDLGGGTFDASVVRQTAAGFEVLSSEGLGDAGGLDVDAAIVASLATACAERDPHTWAQLVEPHDAKAYRARRLLWEDVRTAKEMLSRASNATVHVPEIGMDWPIGREEFEVLARPVLDRTVDCARAAVRAAGIEPESLGGVLLVGGSSRIPLAATLLHRAFGIAPVMVDQPELVVAQGALPSAAETAAVPPLRPPAGLPGESGADTPLQGGGTADQGGPGRRWAAVRRRGHVISVVALVAILGIAGVVSDAAGLWDRGNDGTGADLATGGGPTLGLATNTTPGPTPTGTATGKPTPGGVGPTKAGVGGPSGSTRVSPSAAAATGRTSAPPTGGCLRAAFAKADTWSDGYAADYIITNNCTATTTSWRLEFDLPAGTTLDQAWNSEYTHDGQHYVLTPVDYSREIKPGGSEDPGFNTSGFGVPINCRINGSPC